MRKNERLDTKDSALGSEADHAVEQAMAEAQKHFRHFWREVAWERRRIAPALDLALVKAAFSDSEDGSDSTDSSAAEDLWLADVDFDGQTLFATVQNQPAELKSVSEGDNVALGLEDLSDWLYAVDGKVYGGFTVACRRSQMSAAERDAYDDEWGLDFGDPESIRLVPEDWFPSGNDPSRSEHPMSINTAKTLIDFINADPANLNEQDEEGFALLHEMALGGSATCVRILLEHGADQSLRTQHGMTALDLATVLDWQTVIELLKK